LEELHNGDIHDLHVSPNKIRMIKSIRIRRVGPTAYGVKRNAYRNFGAKLISKKSTKKAYT
jgi:hypothetical protein